MRPRVCVAALKNVAASVNRCHGSAAFKRALADNSMISYPDVGCRYDDVLRTERFQLHGLEDSVGRSVPNRHSKRR